MVAMRIFDFCARLGYTEKRKAMALCSGICAGFVGQLVVVL
jgi:hypothetical protein